MTLGETAAQQVSCFCREWKSKKRNESEDERAKRPANKGSRNTQKYHSPDVNCFSKNILKKKNPSIFFNADDPWTML